MISGSDVLYNVLITDVVLAEAQKNRAKGASGLDLYLITLKRLVHSFHCSALVSCRLVLK